jgi:large-conductance mechanosensitive channel
MWDLNKDFKDFVLRNNIASTMAAVTIAFSTGTTIRSLACDIILPCIYAAFVKRMNILSGAFEPIRSINIDNFIKELFTWIMVVLITFLLIEYVFRYWMLHVPVISSAHEPVSALQVSNEHFKSKGTDEDIATYVGDTLYPPWNVISENVMES